jgi:E3 ubiquitin-protein ligase SHPRH
VLTTYAALREDLGHTGVLEGNEKAKRYVKKYRALPTPLTGVQWWRICLDESQMLGEGSAGAAMMAIGLGAVNRWGVSGTPIQKGLEDLYGLFLFLGVQPYANRTWWRACLQEPYLNEVPEAVERMELLMRRFLWRTNKQDALAEVDLPPLEEHVIKVKFSEVEEFLYRKRHDECSFKVHSLMEKYGKTAHSVPQGAMKRIMASVLTLRQMCCHPQLGSKTGLQSLAKCTMTMPQLLDQLIIKVRYPA